MNDRLKSVVKNDFQLARIPTNGFACAAPNIPKEMPDAMATDAPKSEPWKNMAVMRLKRKPNIAPISWMPRSHGAIKSSRKVESSRSHDGAAFFRGLGGIWHRSLYTALFTYANDRMTGVI
jgi:hypothetical protein